MYKMIKATLTGVFIVALASSLFFLGKPALSRDTGGSILDKLTQAPFTLERHYKPVW